MIEQVSIVAEESQRLDVCLAGGTSFSRSRIAGLIKDGQVLVNGTIRNKASARVEKGDRIELAVPEVKQTGIEAEDIPLEILYQDEDIAVLNKPCGMVVHPAAGNEHGTVVNALLYQIGDLSGIGGEMRPGIVHRLDKDTSGILIIAKNDQAHLALSQQFQDRTLEKHYRAVVFGRMKEERGRIEAAIGRDERDRKKMTVRPDGKPAVTEWTLLKSYAQAAYLDVHILTGRTHQIRVHMKSIGHPVLGDPIYAGKASVNVHVPRLMLHAFTLSVLHPRTGERMTFTAPLPDAFESVIRKLS